MGLWLTLTSMSTPQTPPQPSIAAQRVAVPPRVDGSAKDEAWGQAPRHGGFYQQKPQAGAPISEQTWFQVVYDDKALYFLVRCEDSQARDIKAVMTRRDRLLENDLVVIALDSRHDHKSAFQYFVSAAGVQIDELRYDDTSQSREWDGIWDSSVQRDDHGWTAEIMIPFSELRYNGEEEIVMGLQVGRYLARTTETQLWAPVGPRESSWVGRFGDLRGLKDLPRSRPLVLIPYAAGGMTFSNMPALRLPTLQRPRVGLDVKYSLTKDLTLDATVLPDFGQVEADEVVVNLGQFETFFPEKRPFFQEGRHLFSMSQQSGWQSANMVLPFYSRRVGAEQPIMAAAKITGTAYRQLSVAWLDAVVAPEVGNLEISRAQNLSVQRVVWQQDDLSVGGLFTQVLRPGARQEDEPSHEALVAAADAVWKPLHGNLLFSLLGMGTLKVDDHPSDGTQPGLTSSGAGGKFRAFKQGGTLRLGMEYELYTPGFDVNDLGYQQRADLQHVLLTAGLVSDNPSYFFREYGFTLVGNVVSTFDLQPLYSNVSVDGWSVLKNNWQLGGGMVLRTPRMDDLETEDRQAMVYRPTAVSAWGWGSTDARKKVVVGASLEAGNTDNGLFVGGDTWCNVTPLPRWELNGKVFGGYQGNELKMLDNEGNSYLFARRSALYYGGQLRTTLAVTHAFSLQAQAQAVISDSEYSHPGTIQKQGAGSHAWQRRQVIEQRALTPVDQSVARAFNEHQGTLIWQVVARHEFSPGSTFFLVYSHNANHEDARQVHRPVGSAVGLIKSGSEDRIEAKVSLRMPM